MDLRIKLFRRQGGYLARVRLLDANGVAWRTYLLPDGDGETVTLSRAQEQAAHHAQASLRKIHGGRVPAHAHQLMMEVDMSGKQPGTKLKCGDCIAFMPTRDLQEGVCWETGEPTLANAVACPKIKPWEDYPVETIRGPR